MDTPEARVLFFLCSNACRTPSARTIGSSLLSRVSRLRKAVVEEGALSLTMILLLHRLLLGRMKESKGGLSRWCYGIVVLGEGRLGLWRDMRLVRGWGIRVRLELLLVCLAGWLRKENRISKIWEGRWGGGADRGT